MKNVFKHSREKHVGYFLGGLVFVSLFGIQLIVNEENRIVNALCLGFTGLITMYYLLTLVDPKTEFIVPGTEEEKRFIKTTEGRYTYSAEGFMITTYDEYEGTRFKHNIRWKDIQQIKLHKIRVPDLVYQGLRIYYQTKVYETNETYEGYFVLVERIRQSVEGIEKDWQLDEPIELYHTTEKILFKKEDNDS